jgi:hypothetical protein
MKRTVRPYHLSCAAAVAAALLMSLPVHGQELKKVRIGYPAFSLTFLTFFVAKMQESTKSTGWTSR